MKKNLTTRRAACYLFYLLCTCALVLGETSAQFSSQVSGTAAVAAASVELDSVLSLNDRLKDLTPGKETKITFQVTNQKNNVVSEVAQEYSITLQTTGNLPLTYSLKKSSTENSLGTSVGMPTGGSDTGADTGKQIVWDGGLLPYAAGGVTHTYELTVTWPVDKNAPQYADEVDAVSLIVDAQQVQPKNEQGGK